ncbi:MAG: PKD domain-containing protein, partial [Candidatus Micrarchaeaceae archaeon]
TAPLGSVYPGTTFTFDANDTSNIGLPKCSTPKNVSILEYIWDFGNGQTASGPLASITYNPGLGDFQVSVRLTVTDSLGRVSSAAQIVNLSSSGFARTNL